MPKSNHYRDGVKRKKTKCPHDGSACTVGKPCNQCGRVVGKKPAVRLRHQPH